MWSRNSNRVNFRDMKGGMTQISKDKVLRMSAFDAVRAMISEVTTLSFRERFEAFFIDYSLTPLLVQQNYIKAVESGTRVRLVTVEHVSTQPHASLFWFVLCCVVLSCLV